MRYCTSCGIPLGSYSGDYAGASTEISGGMKILLYILSLLFPIAGFVIGAIYYMNPDEEFKHVGKICLLLGVLSIFLTFCCAVMLYVMVLGFVA